MEVIEDKNRKEVLDYLSSIKDKKIVGTIDIVGSVHDGHLSIIKDCKKESDILVVEYSQFWMDARLFFQHGTFTPSFYKPLRFDSFLDKVRGIEDHVDYVVFSPMTPEILEKTFYLKEKYRESFKKLYDYWEIPSSYTFGLTYALHSDVIPACTKAFVSCKNIIQGMSMKKLVDPADTQYDPQMIWKIYRKETGDAISRTSSDPTMGYIVRNVKGCLENEKSGIETILEIQRSLYLERPEFSIIDLTTSEKLDRLTDNCVIVMRDRTREDYVFIKDGHLIF
jgi:hypothetical protein